jgi:hypothetical protein
LAQVWLKNEGLTTNLYSCQEFGLPPDSEQSGLVRESHL